MMFNDSQARQFLHELIERVWQDARIERIEQFYTTDVIGHFQKKTFGLLEIKERMSRLDDFSLKRRFHIQESVVIDDLIVFRMRQVWLSVPEEKLCEALLTGVYRIRDNKVCELWLMVDSEQTSYSLINQNIVGKMSKYQIDVQDKQKFLQYINDYQYFERGQKVVLTRREQEALYYFLNGFTSKEAAEEMNLSYRTVESYIATIKQKYNCSMKSELRKKLFPQEK